MADERVNNEGAPTGVVETTDRGLFDFMKKKEEEAKTSSEHDNMASGVEKVHISQQPDQCNKEEEKKHESLLEKLHHSDSSSSSSDEEGDDEERKKRKKERKEKKKGGLKDKIEEKLGVGHNKEEHDDTNVPIEKIHVQEEEKKQEGFFDKIKDKMPGHHSGEDAKVAAPVAGHHEPPCAEEEKEKEKEKKGFLDKIKDKIPGFHSKGDSVEEKKDHHEDKKEGY